MGCFDLINIMFIIKLNNIRGDLTDESAKTQALTVIGAAFEEWARMGSV